MKESEWIKMLKVEQRKMKDHSCWMRKDETQRVREDERKDGVRRDYFFPFFYRTFSLSSSYLSLSLFRSWKECFSNIILFFATELIAEHVEFVERYVLYPSFTCKELPCSPLFQLKEEGK